MENHSRSLVLIETIRVLPTGKMEVWTPVKVFVCLGYQPNADMTAFEGLIGDQEIKSDSKLAQKANPVVWKITMRR